MAANPALGVFFHWLGGLASGSFYVPYRGVRRWSWETYWLVGGFFSWIIAPWFLGHLMTRDLLAVLSESPKNKLGASHSPGNFRLFGGHRGCWSRRDFQRTRDVAGTAEARH